MSPIYLREHDELFWWILSRREIKPKTLVNIDAHSDMTMFGGSLNIGNFISKMAHEGWVDTVVWVKDKRSIDFEEGDYQFKVGKTRENSLALYASLEKPFYFLQKSFAREENLKEVKDLRLVVISDFSETFQGKNREWILSVDYDYFGCKNPHKDKIDFFVNQYGEKIIEEFKKKGRLVETSLEWNLFLKMAEKEIPGISELPNHLFPNFKDSNSRILEKADLARHWIHKSFSMKNCCGMYGVFSDSSGFSDQKNQVFVHQAVKELFENLLKEMVGQ